MSSPFPGMDPYLEQPDVWRGFHHHLAEEVMRRINPLLGSRYYADVDVTFSVEDVHIAASERPTAPVPDSNESEKGRFGSADGAVRSTVAVRQAEA